MAQNHTELQKVRGDSWRTCRCGFYCLAADIAYWLEHLVNTTLASPHLTCTSEEKQTTPSCGWQTGDKVCGDSKNLSKQVTGGNGYTPIPICDKHILDAWRAYPDPVVSPL